ncbi:uncharacterized protein LOC132452670 [Gadus macrocephalus]|uniref:uncharacterized protein LOC132452670 n=1 Tax=Gadus macrocephalus TaxID=80720 RepID=UPI0028CB7586|nr:uncharacterized protein LOC132452670 [Gadus macrocephalus]
MLCGEKLGLTTDGWSSLATESYVTVTAHFIDEDWERRNVFLDTSELQTAHTAANVSTCIDSILQEYQVERQSVLAITTDNATNYVSAVETYWRITDVPCMAHTINLDVPQQVKDVLKPFKVATRALSTEHYPTASADLPLQYVLLTQLKPSNDEPAGLREMKTMMSTILKARYGPNKDAFFAQPATLTRVLNWLVPLERASRQAVRDKVQRELADLSEESGAEGQDEIATTTVPQQCKEKCALSAMVDLFGDVYCQNSAGADRPTEDVHQRELMAYDNEPPPRLTATPCTGGRREAPSTPISPSWHPATWQYGRHP